jgi:hypothetical protein
MAPIGSWGKLICDTHMGNTLTPSSPSSFHPLIHTYHQIFGSSTIDFTKNRGEIEREGESNESESMGWGGVGEGAEVGEGKKDRI